MANIGFIGLGHMGNPMVRNLIAAGHTLYVYDLVAAAVEELVSCGAQAADNIASLAEVSDVVITMLQTGEQVSKVCLGDEGIFAKAKAQTLIIDSSSIDVETSRALHNAAHVANLMMVDAPVSGGVAGAEAGSLTVMVGGSEEAFKLAHPVLAIYGKNIVHAGEAGNGQVAKICNNRILGISMIAISEAYTLGEKLGLAAEKLFEISSKASGRCWSMTQYSPVPGLMENVPSNNDYQPGFTAQMMLKDLRLSQQAATAATVETPLGAQATAMYDSFVNQGNDQLDFSAIIKMLQQSERS